MSLIITYTLGLALSSILIILLITKSNYSKSIKVLLFVTGNAILISSQLFFSPIRNQAVIFPVIYIFLLNLFAIRSMLLKGVADHSKFKMWSEDPMYWKAGVFYFNPDDKRIFPPKRISGLGWTINFANPFSVILFILLITLIIASVEMMIS